MFAFIVIVSTLIPGVTLDQRLQAEPIDVIVRDALRSGDAARGAIVFHQPFMACQSCHSSDDGQTQLGPNLSQWEEPTTNQQLVESILYPSKSIRKGFETFNVITNDGQNAVGLMLEQTPDTVTLRDPTQPGVPLVFERSDIDEIQRTDQSMMPQGLANQLASRQQFLDLVRYLIEIRDGGATAARRLQPAPHLFAARPLPEYEKQIDHAGMITALDDDSFDRGKAVYDRLCVNCHGTVTKPGSLPTSLRFGDGKFKSGADPFTMYQTLTRGFGMMQPQTWMVPQQKYDVVHYIREAYLKPHNPSQHFEVTAEWLASLPTGSSRGPAAQTLEPWVTMDYGRTLINTYEIGSDQSNIAQKGIAIRLDDGPGGISRGRHWMIFDHDTLRMAAAWSDSDGDDAQFVDWAGIHFDGAHGRHPHVMGHVHTENKTGPGWADPATGSWRDDRVVGRDGRHYGPLPRSWAHYQGMYYHDDQTVIAYRVGTTEILEQPTLLVEEPHPVFARRLEVGTRETALSVQVGQLPASYNLLIERSDKTVLLGPGDSNRSNNDHDAENRANGLLFDGATFAQVDNAARHFETSNNSFSIAARIRGNQDQEMAGPLFAQCAANGEWVPDGKVLYVEDGRLVFDIGWVGDVESNRGLDRDRWNDVVMSWNHETALTRFFVNGKLAGEGKLRPRSKTSAAKFVTRMGFAAPDFPDSATHFHGKMASLQIYASDLTLSQVKQPATRPKPLGDWQFRGIDDTATRKDGQVRNRAADHGHATVRRTTGGQAVAHWLAAGVIEDAGEGERELSWTADDGNLRLTIPPGGPRHLTLWFTSLTAPDDAAAVTAAVAATATATDAYRLTDLMSGGTARWAEAVVTQPILGDESQAFAVDVLTRPAANPWLTQVRLTGFDFFADGDTMAVCAWDGDVWHVSGIDQLDRPLVWKRIASGLFQPLGVRIVDGDIYVTCRDQIVILRDKNGDGETDFYQSFNNDHQVTEHFHEFAMGLQTDEKGNFYYAKSARHALPAVVPHHGTLLRVSPDGERTEILAKGFRAANGVCLNPDGSFIVTDQEGHWNPKNRINWVQEGGFYGNMYGYHDVTDESDEAMSQPLCWITNSFDRSPAELLWVPRGTWGPLGGSLLNLSYGYGKVFVVPHEKIGKQVQGGMCELPIPQFPTGLIRGRFHPTNGHLYACGMFAWAGNQQQPGGFYRLRATGKPMYLPVQLRAQKTGVQIEWTDPISRAAAEDPKNYQITAWDLKRTKNYGSDHYNERPWPVERAELASDGKTVTLSIPDIAPTWSMEIRAFLESPDGTAFDRRIHNTIHGF